MIPGLVFAALASTAFPPSATYRYTGALGGQQIGSWSVTVTGNAQAEQLKETSSASIYGMPLAATATLVLGPDFAPSSYSGSYRTPSQTPTVSVTMSPNAATVVGALSSQPRTIALDRDTRHFVIIEPGLLAGLFALPAQLNAWKDATVTWITPVTAQAESLSINSSPAIARPAAIPAGDALLAVARPMAVTIWYDPSTLVPDEIEVPSQNAVLKRERS